jgi:hypothetical protein
MMTAGASYANVTQACDRLSKRTDVGVGRKGARS